MQSSASDGFKFPKGRRKKGKLLAGVPVAANPNTPNPKDIMKPSSNSQPLFKQPFRFDPNFVFLWNAGGKRKNKKCPADEPTPQIVLIDKIPIYIKKLTSTQAAANGVVGWDQVLADVKQLHHEAAVSHIASFWASWKREQQLTLRENAKKNSTMKSLEQTQADRLNQLTHWLQTNPLLPSPLPLWAREQGRGSVRLLHCLPSLLESRHATTLTPPRLALENQKRTTRKSCGSIQLRLKKALLQRPISTS